LPGDSVYFDHWIPPSIDQFILLIIKTFGWSIFSGKWWPVSVENAPDNRLSMIKSIGHSTRKKTEITTLEFLFCLSYEIKNKLVNRGIFHEVGFDQKSLTVLFYACNQGTGKEEVCPSKKE
jgi:hypothetical protein